MSMPFAGITTTTVLVVLVLQVMTLVPLLRTLNWVTLATHRVMLIVIGSTVSAGCGADVAVACGGRAPSVAVGLDVFEVWVLVDGALPLAEGVANGEKVA